MFLQTLLGFSVIISQLMDQNRGTALIDADLWGAIVVKLLPTMMLLSFSGS